MTSVQRCDIDGLIATAELRLAVLPLYSACMKRHTIGMQYLCSVQRNAVRIGNKDACFISAYFQRAVDKAAPISCHFTHNQTCGPIGKVAVLVNCAGHFSSHCSQ